jgi:hypothetical protein
VAQQPGVGKKKPQEPEQEPGVEQRHQAQEPGQHFLDEDDFLQRNIDCFCMG